MKQCTIKFSELSNVECTIIDIGDDDNTKCINCKYYKER